MRLPWALQQVALSVMPYGCSRDLVPQTCTMLSRPAKSCRSHTRVRQIACREEAHMYQTKHDLPAPTRADVIVLLNARLADSIDLMHQAKQAHWNVKEPSFIALHKLFDEVIDLAEDSMDLLAERVVQLGGTAEGTLQVATARTGLKAYPLTLAEEREHVEALSSALAAYGTSVRQGIEQADARGDRDTADIFTEISRGVDKHLWFVEAHLG